MKYEISFKQRDIDLNIDESASKQEKFSLYLNKIGGAEAFLNHFFKYATITKSNIEDVEYNRVDSQEATS